MLRPPFSLMSRAPRAMPDAHGTALPQGVISSRIMARVPRHVLAAVLLAAAGCGGAPPSAPTGGDGPSARTPTLLKDIAVGSASSALSLHAASAGDILFFVADDGSHGEQLWRTDGTSAGTGLVAAVAAGPNDGRRWNGGLTPVGPQVFFHVDDGVRGKELWCSDGTGSGTVRLQDLVPGPGSADLALLTSVGRRLFFVARDDRAPSTSFALFQSDGTPGGTVLVRNLGARYSSGSQPPMLRGSLDVNGTFFFAWDNEIWTSDGSAAGTLPVFAGVTAWDSGRLPLTARGGRLFFVAGAYDDRGAPTRLWSSDGTAGGTVLVRDVGTRTAATALLAAGPRVFFALSEVNALWGSDGTAEGTAPVLSLPRRPLLLGNTGDIALLAVGNELWRSDGHAAGTGILARFADLGGGVAADGRFYFAADDGVHGTELWQTDGTVDGTQLVSDLRPGPESSTPSGLIVSGGRLYFWADDGSRGREPWSLVL